MAHPRIQPLQSVRSIFVTGKPAPFSRSTSFIPARHFEKQNWLTIYPNWKIMREPKGHRQIWETICMFVSLFVFFFMIVIIFSFTITIVICVSIVVVFIFSAICLLTAGINKVSVYCDLLPFLDILKIISSACCISVWHFCIIYIDFE